MSTYSQAYRFAAFADGGRVVVERTQGNLWEWSEVDDRTRCEICSDVMLAGTLGFRPTGTRGLTRTYERLCAQCVKARTARFVLDE